MSGVEEDVVSTLLRRVKEGDRQAREELFALLGSETEQGGVILAMARKVLPKDHWARQLVESQDIV